MDALIAVAGFLLTLVLLALISALIRRALTQQVGGPTVEWGQRERPRDPRPLWAMIVVALIYSVLIRFLPLLTGVPLLDGSIGLALGLYICSLPAANAINMLFFERDALRRISEWSVLRWLALNLLTLLAGWMVVFVALRRIVERAI